jgi:hypothetical protein
MDKRSIGSLLSLLSDYFKNFTMMLKEHQGAYTTPSGLRAALFEFRKHLVALAGEDLSSDPRFHATLHAAWRQLAEEKEDLLEETKGVAIPIISKCTFFEEQLALYPLGAEHPISYYFSHCVGGDWIPLPFVHILFQLYTEFKDAPTTSTLQSWIVLLDDMLAGKN